MPLLLSGYGMGQQKMQMPQLAIFERPIVLREDGLDVDANLRAKI